MSSRLIAACVTAPRRGARYIGTSTGRAEDKIYQACLKLSNPIAVCRWLRFLVWLAYPIYCLVWLAINYPSLH